MPIQPGETIIDDFVVWEVEPDFPEYVDGDSGVGGNPLIGVLGEQSIASSRSFRRGILNQAFSGSYDRAEAVESLYVTVGMYGFIVTYSNGQVLNYKYRSRGVISSYKITLSNARLSYPIPQPLPVLRDISEPHNYKVTGVPPNQATAVSWEIDTGVSYADIFEGGDLFWGFFTEQPFNIPSYLYAKSWNNTPRNSNYIYEPNIGILYEIWEIPTVIRFYKNVPKPNYIDLLSGYPLDSRSIPNQPAILPTADRDITISYYRENKLEPVPKLRSIDWMNYQCQLKKDVRYVLPIIDCTLGTLITDEDTMQTILDLSDLDGSYPYKYYFRQSLPQLFAAWNLLFNPTGSNLPANTVQIRLLRVMGANNDFWNNRSNPTSDLNVDMEHPMFIVDNQREFNWHVKPQLDGSYGDLIMNSPKIEEIHAALDAGNYSLNPLNPSNPRITNLGHLIEKIAFLLGYRPNPEGKYDEQFEKSKVRRIISSKQQIDKTKIGINNFGVAGMLLHRMMNRFKGKEIVADECVIIQDIPQLIGEYIDRINLALGLQESSAIEINNEVGTARYENQLQVLIELVSVVKSNQEMLRAALTSSLVTQGQTSEIIGGIGLPSLTKTFTINIDGKSKQLPYKGISPHRSLSQEIATATYNAGLATGQLL